MKTITFSRSSQGLAVLQAHLKISSSRLIQSLGLMFVVVFMWASSSELLADPKASRKVIREVRRELTLGERAIKKKNYRQALKHFVRAEELIPDIKNKISIATLYHRLNRCSDSFYAWIDVISLCAEGCPYKDRAQHAYEEMTSSCTAPLNITSAPTASVMIDGRYLGMTPISPPLLYGSHRLQLKADGYRMIERDIHIEPLKAYQSPQSLDLSLEPLYEQPEVLLARAPVAVSVSARPVNWKRITRILSFSLGTAVGTFALVSHGRAPPYDRGFLSRPRRGNQLLLVGAGMFLITGISTYF